MDTLDVRQEGETLVLAARGKLGAGLVQRVWTPTLQRVKDSRPARVRVDGREVSACDGAGIAFLLQLQQEQRQRKRSFEMEGFRQDLRQLIETSTIRSDVRPIPRFSRFVKIAAETGQGAWHLLSGTHRQIAFTGELAWKTALLPVSPHRFRWGDFFLLAEKAGSNGIGIVSLLGFLIGLILAFQSAIALQMFGAEIYVADLVVLTMFRELGPLITAFIVASRSGSAYAAELGTMKVNEELDALTTSGLDPVRFLIVPRVLALVAVLPLLTLFNNLFSLLGAQLVMVGMGYSSTIFWDHATSAAGLNDLLGGLLKTFVFGFLIGLIGCYRGMQTGRGASAVGDSATRAVVACMVMLVVVDFLFAVLYYTLGI